MSREDLFSGAWKLNLEKSEFDHNHRPASATMRWDPIPDGYQMVAEGTTSDGKRVQERPATFILDGQDHPAQNSPGCSAVMSRPMSNTIEVESKKAGRVVGKARYVVSGDQSTLTASVSGIDAQQRSFQVVLVWDRL